MVPGLLFTAALVTVSAVNFCFGTDYTPPRKDLVILESGEQVKGVIQDVNGGIIKIKTDNGLKTIIREVNIYSPRDIVEAGILKKRIHAGTVKHLGSDSLKIQTSSGVFEIKKSQIRKIIISHETILPPLDL